MHLLFLLVLSPAASPAFSAGSGEPPAAALEAPPIEVDKEAFAVAVSSRTPVDAADSFDASVKQLYFWSRIKTQKPPVLIRHVWYEGGKRAAEYTFRIRYFHSRVWSRKRVRPGLWRVDVEDEKGSVLMTSTCIVRPPPK